MAGLKPVFHNAASADVAARLRVAWLTDETLDRSIGIAVGNSRRQLDGG